MTPKYYAFIDGEQRGPFELDRLAEAGVRPSTYVWCKGMDDWHRADEVEEIRNAFRNHISRHHSVESTVPVEEIKPAATLEAGKKPEPPQRAGYPFPQSAEPEPDFNTPPQISLTLAVLSLILCFLPTGILAVVFAYKSQKTWESSLNSGGGEQAEELRRKAHEFGRLAKMWLGLTVAFGIIFWTLVFSVKN